MVKAFFNKKNKSIESRILNQLEKADSKVYCAVAWLTNTNLLNALVRLKHHIEIRVLIFDSPINYCYPSVFKKHKEVIKKSNVNFYIWKGATEKEQMHNKFCIIDDIVITGSYNWSKAANRNKENILIVRDEVIVKKYKKEFDKITRNLKHIDVKEYKREAKKWKARCKDILS